jgi:alpha-tubulin suppressor-like RCC1 family protein
LSNVTAIAAGEYHSLALQSNGTVVAWGYNGSGQTSVPAGLSDVVAIAGGGDFSLALQANGTVVAWGDNSYGETTVPAGLSNVVAIAAGFYHALALEANGSVVGWGEDYDGQTTIPAGLNNVVAIAAGEVDSLALLGDGSPVILQRPFTGLLYSGMTATLSVGVVGASPLSYQWQLSGTNLAGATNSTITLTNVQTVNAGVYTVLVTNTLGKTASLATIAVSNSAPIIVTQPANEWVLPGANASFSVGVSGSQPLLGYQWQRNGTNLAGATQAVLNLTNIMSTNLGSYRVAVSNAFGLTLSSNAALEEVSAFLTAWGEDQSGQTNVPSDLAGVSAIAGGQNFSLAVLANGTVAAWGDNSYGQTNVPAGLSNVVAVAAGYYHALALQSNGTIVGWGDNSYGEAAAPAGLSNVMAIAAGYDFSLALQANGTVVAWGYNGYSATLVPAGLNNVVAIAAGIGSGLALQANGTVVAWGDNSYGEATIPAGLSNVVAIAAGDYHDLALQANGQVVAWGYDGYGQTTVPATLSNVVAVAAGGYFSLALQNNGTIVGWGDNSYGQTTTPAGLSNMVAIAAGGYHTLAEYNNGAPAIIRPPAAGSLFSGVNELLSVGVVSDLPFTYQWQLNGTNLAGATNASLSLTNAQAANSGKYTVIISNALGQASSGVTLAISNSAPIIVAQPASQTVLSGASASLSVGVTGSLPLLGYQWRLNGTNLAGATQATLNLASVTATNLGNYRVAVSNAYGLALSSNATLAAVASLVMAWGDDESGQTNVPPGLGNVTAVAGGLAFSLALQANGRVVGWGDNEYQETNVPAGLSGVVAIAAGGDFGLALQTNGTVSAWGGDSYYGETNLPAGLSNVVAIAAGTYHSLALQSNGTVTAWGYNGSGQTNVPAGLSNVVAIAAGGYFSVALLANGTVIAWGDDSEGELAVPASLSNVVAIAAGVYHGLALQANGTVVGWGYNGYGQTTVPGTLSNVVAISAGYYNSLALQANGTLVGWGYNGYGENTTPAGISNFIAVASGESHTIAVFNNGAPSVTREPLAANADSGGGVVLSVGATGASPLSYQWSFNGTNIAGATNVVLTLINAQLTNSGLYTVVVSNSFGVAVSAAGALKVNNSAPVITAQPASQTVMLGGNAAFSVGVTGSQPLLGYQWQFNGTNLAGATQAALNLTNIVSTNLGLYRVAVSNAFGRVTSSNAVLARALSAVAAWGYNGSGQTNVPAGLNNVVAIAAGGYFNLALQSGGTVAAWGDNSYGETNTAGLSNIVAIAVGTYHGLALSNNGTVAAWGYNGDSQTTVPVGLSNVRAIAAGSYFSLALQSNGTVVAWGDDSYGETNVPPGLSNVIAIAGGAYHALALQSNGTVVAWGYDSNGQTNVPAGLSNVVAIAGGDYHSLALQANGVVVGWGEDSYGEASLPAGVSNVISISAGYYDSLALEANGTVVAWGYNAYGDTTVPAYVSNAVAIAAGTYTDLALLHDASPFITQEPTSTLADSGATAILSVGLGGETPLSYQWTLNGTNLIGATNATLTLTNLQAANAGVYTVVVSNALGTVTSGGATLTVSNAPPLILAQPASQAVPLGGSAAFSTLASGSLPLKYQWQFNGTNISGATQATFDLGNIAITNLGNYRVAVSNAYGGTLSSNAALTEALTTVAVWGDNTYGQTNVPAGLGTVVGIAECGWTTLALETNGTVVAWGYNTYGQTNVPAGLTNVAAIGGGVYHCLALKRDGTVVAWGNDGDGQTNVPTGLSNVVAIAGGYYHSLALQSNGTVVAWGYNGSGQTAVPAGLSNVVAIAASDYSSFALQNNGRVIAWGDNGYGELNLPAGLSNVVAIAAGFGYGLALESNGLVAAWGDNSQGQTAVPATVSNVMAIAAGYYHALALESNGTLVSWGYNNSGQATVPATASNVVGIAAGGYDSLALRSDGSPYVFRQPVGGNVLSGDTVVLSAVVGGSPPLSCQWLLNGTNLPGATNSELTLTNVQLAGSGVYSLAVSNLLGVADSVNAVLTVSNSAPVILTQPASVSVTWEANALFTVGATGSLPLSYQWQFNGVRLPGATNNSLLITNITGTNLGNYLVLLTNAYGSTTSSLAALNFFPTNDAFSNRLTIVGLTNTINASSLYATKEPGEPNHAGNVGGSSVWWTWTAPTNGLATVNTFGSSFDTLLAVYTGSSVANLSVVASNDDSGVLLTSQVSFPAVMGTAYQIAVDGCNGAAGSIFLQVQEGPFGPPIITAQPQSQTGTLGASATFSVGASGVGPLSYQWQSNSVPLLGATNALLTLYNLQAANAAAYRVVVTNPYGGVTSSNAVLSLVAGPPNDMFANRIPIVGLASTVAGSNVFATKEPGEPDHGGNSGGSSVWWTWTAPTNGTAALNTLGSAFETVLAVYTGNVVSNLTLVAADDGYSGYRDYNESVVDFAAVQGTAYQIAVDGFDGATGNIMLNLQETPYSPTVSGVVPLLLKAAVQGKSLVLSFNSSPGLSYTIQYKNSLKTAGWLVLTNVLATGTNTVCHDSITNSPQRFYRIAPATALPTIVLRGTLFGKLQQGLLLSFNSSTGVNYTVQFTTNLPGASWQTLTNLTATATNTICGDYVTNSPRRFYRVMTSGN